MACARNPAEPAVKHSTCVRRRQALQPYPTSTTAMGAAGARANRANAPEGGYLRPWLISTHSPCLLGAVRSELAVLVQVDDVVLAAEGDVLARGGDGVAGELQRLLVPLVVVDGRRLGGARVAAVVGPDALAGDQLLLAVAVDVAPAQGVGLGPALVDGVLLPRGGAVGRRGLLLPPVQAAVVPAPEDDVQAAVAVQVLAPRTGSSGGARRSPGGASRARPRCRPPAARTSRPRSARPRGRRR